MASTSRTGGQLRDPCWKHRMLGAGQGEVTCIDCTKPMNGGINQLKYHFPQISCQNVRTCEVATTKVEEDAIFFLITYEQRKADKKRTTEAMVTPILVFSSTGSHGDI